MRRSFFSLRGTSQGLGRCRGGGAEIAQSTSQTRRGEARPCARRARAARRSPVRRDNNSQGPGLRTGPSWSSVGPSLQAVRFTMVVLQVSGTIYLPTHPPTNTSLRTMVCPCFERRCARIPGATWLGLSIDSATNGVLRPSSVGRSPRPASKYKHEGHTVTKPPRTSTFPVRGSL